MPTTSGRKVAGVALASVAALALASCSSGDDSSGGGGSGDSAPVTLSMVAGFGTPNAQASIETLIEEFEAANPGITIEANFVPYATYDNVLGTQLSSGNHPDIIFSLGTGSTFPSFTGSLAESGILLDASDQEWTSRIPEDIRPLVGAAGKVYSWPVYVTYTGVIYNMSALQEAGVQPPETWSEVLPYCEKMRAAGKTPYAIPLGDPVAVPGQSFDSIAATTVSSENPTWDQDRALGETTFASTPGWTTAFEKFMDMSDSGCFPDNATAVNQQQNMAQVSSGEAGGWMANHSALPYVQSASADFEFRPFPAQDSGNWAQATVYDAWSVTKDTEHPEEALAWLDFVANPERNRWHAEQSGGIAVVDYENSELTESVDERLAPLVDTGQVHWYGFWPAGVATNVVGPGMQSLYLDDITIPELLKQMDSAWDSTAEK